MLDDIVWQAEIYKGIEQSIKRLRVGIGSAVPDGKLDAKPRILRPKKECHDSSPSCPKTISNRRHPRSMYRPKMVFAGRESTLTGLAVDVTMKWYPGTECASTLPGPT